MSEKVQVLGLHNDEITLDHLYIPEQTAPQIAIANLRDKESIVLGAADFPDYEGIEEKHVTITYHHHPKATRSSYIVQNGTQDQASNSGVYTLDYLNQKEKIQNQTLAYSGTWIEFGDAAIELPVNFNDYSPEVLTLGETILPNIPKSIILNENNTHYAMTPYGEYIAHSDRGIGARKTNQDGLLTFLSPKGMLMLNVFDGMGGHAGSEVATSIISEHFARAFTEGEDLYNAAARAGKAMEQAAANGLGGSEMGACFLSAKIEQNTCVFYHMGDCKGIVFNLHTEDLSTKSETKDHTISGTVDGRTKEFVTQSISLLDGEYGMRIPDESKEPVSLLKNSWVVMGSDGLWKVMGVDQIKETIRDFSNQKEEYQNAAKERGEEFNELLELMRIINHKAKLGAFYTGKDDNFTIILYRHMV